MAVFQFEKTDHTLYSQIYSEALYVWQRITAFLRHQFTVISNAVSKQNVLELHIYIALAVFYHQYVYLS